MGHLKRLFSQLCVRRTECLSDLRTAGKNEASITFIYLPNIDYLKKDRLLTIDKTIYLILCNKILLLRSKTGTHK